MEMGRKVDIFCHIYYSDSYSRILDLLKPLAEDHSFRFLFSICRDNPEWSTIANQIKLRLPQSQCLIIPNKGKDIGGKLILLSKYFREQWTSDFLVFVHDKKSPQAVDGVTWSSRLLRVIEQTSLDGIFQAFQDGRVGMIGSIEHLVTPNSTVQDSLFATNREYLERLAEEYGITTNERSFIGGSMFWVRTEIYRAFFAKHDPLAIFSTLESGNVMDNHAGTITHSWERLFGWIVTGSGYKIVGI